ncbi:MAG: S4 domain-containing protein, partial [Poseidonia sp.]
MKHHVEEASTLLDALRHLHPQSSSTTLRKMLTQGRVLVNDAVVHRAKHDLSAGDIVQLLDRAKAEELTPPPAPAPPGAR